MSEIDKEVSDYIPAIEFPWVDPKEVERVLKDLLDFRPEPRRKYKFGRSI